MSRQAAPDSRPRSRSADDAESRGTTAAADLPGSETGMVMIRGAKWGVEVPACARPGDDWVRARPPAGPSHRHEQRSASSSCSVALQGDVTRPHIP